MAETNEYSKAKQIKSLLCVLGTGFLAALVLSISMLYYYNPHGKYLAENVLLTPENAFGLSFAESGARSKERVLFDHFDFSYYNDKTKQKKVIEINREQYAKFYASVSRDISLSDVNDTIRNRFVQGPHASLALVVKSPGGSSKSVFSEVEFSFDGDYYRVQLRQQGAAGGDWAYYYHPGIYRTVMESLLDKS
ncbi:MAG: hypothetical protein WCF65_07160 [Parachlamydiaceae bacterium]